MSINHDIRGVILTDARQCKRFQNQVDNQYLTQFSEILVIFNYVSVRYILCAECCVHIGTLLSVYLIIFSRYSGADPRMVRIGTGPPFWQINHANSAYFRLILGYFGVISAARPPLLDLGPPFLHILDPALILCAFEMVCEFQVKSAYF